MNYYQIPKLKNHLLKQFSLKDQNRENVKKALFMTKLIDIAIEEKTPIAVGHHVFAFNEELLLRSLKEEGVDLELPKDFVTKKEYISEIKSFKTKPEFFAALNMSKTGKNPELMAKNKEERKKLKAEKQKIKKQTKKQQSIKVIEKYKSLLEEGKKGLLFDIECNERNQKQILEIGFVKFNKQGEIEKRHLIVKENYNIRNGRYVEDNKDNYNYGESEQLSLKEVLKTIEKELKESDFIIGHCISNDINFLNKGGLTVNYSKPIINTLKMTHFISKGELSIKNTLKHLNISGDNLHNAGNDAVLNYEIVKGIVRDYDLSLLLKEKVKNIEEKPKTKKSRRNGF